MDYGNIVADGEVVLWEGRPRQKRIFAAQDLIMVPFSLIWTGAVVASAVLFPNPSLLVKVVSLAVAGYLTVGRFFYKAIVKSRTRYLVTDHRALVVRQGELYEHQDITGIVPEITGWNRNRIVTFGDVLESTLTGSVSFRRPVGNLGLPGGRFTVRRGDGSGFPLRFYDLDVDDAEHLMVALKKRPPRGHDALSSRAVTPGFTEQSDSAEERADGVCEGISTGEEPERETAFTRWRGASPWRFILLPVLGATAVSFGVAALTHSPGKGLFPGLVAGVGSFLVYRGRDGASRKE